MKNPEKWFESWFDTPYYHILYKNRDYSEAQSFIQNLFNFLQLPAHSKVLDLACGKGRHAVTINQLGFDVIGLDLSEESIEAAKKLENDSLQFQTGDMRHLNIKERFDITLNLFTSFGYFRQEGDNLKVIQSLAHALKPNGLLVLDYLNVHKVVPTLPHQETIERGGLEFKIHKYVADGFITKAINFEVDGEQKQFYEYVKLIDLDWFKQQFENYGLELLHTFGNYQLEKFEPQSADRLILIAQKR